MRRRQETMEGGSQVPDVPGGGLVARGGHAVKGQNQRARQYGKQIVSQNEPGATAWRFFLNVLGDPGCAHIFLSRE